MRSFRAASSESLAALVDQVEGTSTVADGLFSVAASLRSEPALRRHATDAALPPEAKTGLVGQLYEGKVDAATLGLLKDAVGRRWTRSRDLADALEYVGVVAAVRSSDDADTLVNELFAVRAAIDASSDLRSALSDRTRSHSDKAALVDALLGGKVAPATLTLVKQALTTDEHTVSVALEDFEKIAADVRGRDVATVRVARPLGADDERRLTDALAAQYGRSVHLHVVVDPGVLGGIKVEIGDDVIDGTVASRLDDARRKIAG
ncbi:F0F1 ATP synthase subunit delta [Nocardioides sp. MH1]|uniref:F0F1 ATP synthase subunit delta n=1 Tax=Nocardioides sp. MH1 TaxID=3242490 RepID=UPI00352089F2